MKRILFCACFLISIGATTALMARELDYGAIKLTIVSDENTPPIMLRYDELSDEHRKALDVVLAGLIFTSPKPPEAQAISCEHPPGSKYISCRFGKYACSLEWVEDITFECRDLDP